MITLPFGLQKICADAGMEFNNIMSTKTNLISEWENMQVGITSAKSRKIR